MGASPKYKVYTGDFEYIASCKFGDDAIMIAERNSGTVRVTHSRRDTVWTHGKDSDPTESLDEAFADLQANESALKGGA